jgi:hypothetical protein
VLLPDMRQYHHVISLTLAHRTVAPGAKPARRHL